MAQCHALLEIEEKKETTTVELAGVLDLDKSTLSRTVDGLARLGLIERRPHPTDRRFTLLAPTPAGKKTCEKIHREADDTYLRAFRKIARSRWDEIGRSFEVLATALSECGQAQGKQKSCCT